MTLRPSWTVSKKTTHLRIPHLRLTLLATILCSIFSRIQRTNPSVLTSRHERWTKKQFPLFPDRLGLSLTIREAKSRRNRLLERLESSARENSGAHHRLVCSQRIFRTRKRRAKNKNKKHRTRSFFLPFFFTVLELVTSDVSLEVSFFRCCFR